MSEVLDREGYALRDGVTLLDLFREVNARAGGDKFRNDVLLEDESALAPGVFVLRNSKETLKALETTLCDGDSLFIVSLDLAGG